MEGGIPRLLATAVRTASTRLISENHPVNAEGGQPGAVGAGAHPGTPGPHHVLTPTRQTDTTPETGQRHNQ
jgi:hypothetical protein